MIRGRLNSAVLAQVMAQALTAWTLLVHVFRWPDVSLLELASLLAAAVVPFRHDGSLRDRAAGNFGAGLLIGGFLWWELIMGGLDSIVGGERLDLGAEVLFMLAATVLFTLAGAMFWTLRRNGEEG